jgi:hypothetical protein
MLFSLILAKIKIKNEIGHGFQPNQVCYLCGVKAFQTNGRESG